ncbi:MAG TPA: glycosyltransferase family 39 protein [Bryobacteraceae bacterium]|nr:glycosyltransferase family 39 protein [Bryobacteraceae bacterium]
MKKASGALLGSRAELLVLLIATLVFLTTIVSPPSLMDDVDAFQARMAQNMYQSGDWVTARLDGVRYFDKAPFKYWVTILLYEVLGVHDWVARIPSALSAILMVWVVMRFGRWAINEKAGLYAGIVLSTCIGLFLFTRIIIPDVMLTLAIAVALWAFIRSQDDEETRPRLWAYIMAAALAIGMLIKGMVALALPIAAIFVYLLVSRRLFQLETWKRLHVFTGLLLFLAIAAPWHVLATIRNPPYFDFTMHGGPGEYRGFFWFYFINEQVLRFLNLRYPRDYDTVPRFLFWTLHLVWLFPWSVYIPTVAWLDFRPSHRAGRANLLALCWVAAVLLFFSFSTTQEYYSLPLYPAAALLLGGGMALEGSYISIGGRIVAVIASLGAVVIAATLILTRNLPAPGDISVALMRHPGAYKLSLGHLQDLTLSACAYLRLPLVLAGIACVIGASGAWRLRGERAFLAIAVMMVLFFQAARLALVVFDPYLSSRPLAEALNRLPKGELIEEGDYNSLSSIFFYHEDKTLILNGRFFVLEYGSYAPDAPNVFINDSDFLQLWGRQARCYLVTSARKAARIKTLAQGLPLFEIASAGGKIILSNQAVTP